MGIVSSDIVDNFNHPLPTHHNFKSKVGRQCGSLLVVKYAGKSAEHMYFCKCVCGNYVKVRSSNLSNKHNSSCGCIINISKRNTIEKMMSLVGDKVVVEAKSSVRSVWTFVCPQHGEYKSVFQQVAYHKTGCPVCSKGGYKKNLPGSFYLLAITDINGRLVSFKYGITNGTIEDRIKQLQTKTTFKLSLLLSFHNKDGEVPSIFESIVSQVIGSNYMSKGDLPNGFTETFNPMLIFKFEKLLNLISQGT